MLDRRLQGRQGDRRRMAGLELADVFAQLGRALVQRVTPICIRDFLIQRNRSLRARHAFAMLGQLSVQGGAVGACVGYGATIALQLEQGRLAATDLLAQTLDLAAVDLQIAGVLGAFRLVATDRLLQLASRVLCAAIGAGHRLLQPITQCALVLGQSGQLLLVDARRCAEELLRRQTGQPRNLRLDRGRVVEGLFADAHLYRSALPGEDLPQGPLLVVVLEVELDDRVRLGVAPRSRLVEVLRGRRRPAEQRHLQGSLDGRLAGLVRTSNDVQSGRELHLQVDVALVVLDAKSGDVHRAKPASRGADRRAAGCPDEVPRAAPPRGRRLHVHRARRSARRCHAHKRRGSCPAGRAASQAAT